MGKQPEHDGAEPPGQERLLRGADHAHGDVGLARRQVLGPVAEDELDGNARVGAPEPGQDRGQDFRADDLARGHPHRPALPAARRGAPQGGGGSGHRLGVGPKR